MGEMPPARDLEDHGGEGVAPALDASLTDLVSLGLLAKHARWNLAGPAFGPLRLRFDELAGVVFDAADTIAERAVTLGHHPDSRVETIARENTLPDLPPGEMRDSATVAAFEALLDMVITRLHVAIDTSCDDPVTQDLLVAIAGTLEKQAWMIRAHL